MERSDGVDPTTEEILLRREHLEHEFGIQRIGQLWVGLGALSLLVGVFGLARGLGEALETATFVLYVLGGGYALWTGIRTVRLLPCCRRSATIVASIGLLGFPIGTLIGVRMLYLLQSEKGRRILSPSYQTVRRRTPEIRVQVSPLLRGLKLFFLCLLCAIMFVLIRSRAP